MSRKIQVFATAVLGRRVAATINKHDAFRSPTGTVRVKVLEEWDDEKRTPTLLLQFSGQRQHTTEVIAFLVAGYKARGCRVRLGGPEGRELLNKGGGL